MAIETQKADVYSECHSLALFSSTEVEWIENLFADSCFWTHHLRIIHLISYLRKLSVIVYKFFDVVSLCCVNIIWPIQENTLFKNFGKEIFSLIF